MLSLWIAVLPSITLHLDEDLSIWNYNMIVSDSGCVSTLSLRSTTPSGFIEDVITKKIVYHLFEDEVEFLGCLFLSYLLALEITCSCFHDFIDKDLIDIVLPDVRRYIVVLTGIYYHLKELRCCAQCLIEDEDFIKRSRSTLGEEV
ncbi:hypothetical protein Tco_0554820 [Tanacetum coccineum]